MLAAMTVLRLENLGPLEEQLVLSTVEPSLRPLTTRFEICDCLTVTVSAC